MATMPKKPLKSFRESIKNKVGGSARLSVFHYMDIILKANPTSKDEIRFWKHCDKNGGCWIWKRGLSSDGYGKFSFKRNQKTITCRAHRLSFFFTYKRIDSNLLICHICDNKVCVNPNHLFEGTVKDNALDAKAKGKLFSSKGEQLSNLTETQVLNIRQRIANGESQMELSRELKIGKNAIWHIVHRTTWKHL